MVCCNNGGHLSENFKLQRGSKQGDPISTALFTLCIEILAIKLKNTEGIKGITINNITALISLFADDITLFLEHNEMNLKKVIEVLKDFKYISGLEIQTSKTIACTVGTKDNNNIEKNIICKEENLQWSDKFTLLGVDFDANLEKMNKNIQDKISTWAKIIKHWSYKKCTPIGRVNIVRTFLLSKLNHIAMVYPVLENLNIAELERNIYNFIWGGSKSMKKDDVKANYNVGGLNFPDVATSLKSFNVSWLRRIRKGMETNATWIITLKNLIDECMKDKNIDDFFMLGTKGLRAIRNKCKNKFWKGAFNSMLEILPIFQSKNIDVAMNANIWNNSFFTITKGSFTGKKQEIIEKEKKEIHIYEYVNLKTKFKYPRELLEYRENEGIEFMDFNKAKVKFDMNEKCKEDYIGLIKNIKKIFSINNLNLKHFDLYKPFIPNLYQLSMLQDNGCNLYSRLFKVKLDNEILKTNKDRETEWKKKLGMRENSRFGIDFWENNYKRVKTIKCSMYLRLLQYKINRGCLQVEGFQAKHYRSDGLCRFCKDAPETIPHVFWHCTKTIDFINKVKYFLNGFWPINIRDVTRLQFIFGIDKESFQSPRNFLILLIKEFIWKSLCTYPNLSIEHFKEWFSYEIKTWQLVNAKCGKPVGITFLEKQEYTDAISILYPHESIYDGKHSYIESIVKNIEINFIDTQIKQYSNSDNITA